MRELRPVAPLDTKRHKTGEFDSGAPTLDRWVRAYSGQSRRRTVARTFVTTDSVLKVVAYYTLVASELEHADTSRPVAPGCRGIFRSPSA